MEIMKTGSANVAGCVKVFPRRSSCTATGEHPYTYPITCQKRHLLLSRAMYSPRCLCFHFSLLWFFVFCVSFVSGFQSLDVEKSRGVVAFPLVLILGKFGHPNRIRLCFPGAVILLAKYYTFHCCGHSFIFYLS